MNINDVEGADLTIYDEYGNSFTLDISPLELAVMLKAIGYHRTNEGATVFAENELEKVLKGEVNPFVLIRVEAR